MAFLRQCSLPREEPAGVGIARGLTPHSMNDERSHQRPARKPQRALMLTRLEWPELTFESDQMVSVDFVGRKAKQFDIFQTPGRALIFRKNF